jgi:hypothetical protein
LPPTILSEKAAKDGLAITLMQRLIDQLGDQVCITQNFLFKNENNF